MPRPRTERRRARRSSFLILLILGVAGCTANITRWSNPDVTQQQFMQDRYACLTQAEQPSSGSFFNAYGGAASSRIVASCGVYKACMGAKGYTLDPNGTLATPQGMEASCNR
jgi:hypothetical protein